jgi:hypothetical protein
LLQNLLGSVTFSRRLPVTLTLKVTVWAEYLDMTDLHAKAEKYERKAAKCQESAQRAADGPQKVFFEVLAGYYDGLATDFREVLAKQTTV